MIRACYFERISRSDGEARFDGWPVLRFIIAHSGHGSSDCSTEEENVIWVSKMRQHQRDGKRE